MRQYNNYFDHSKEMSDQAWDYYYKTKDIVTENTKTKNSFKNYFSRLSELVAESYFKQLGHSIIDKEVIGKGNPYDFDLCINESKKKVEVKCIEFRSKCNPAANWNFPIPMKGWNKMYDFYKYEQTVDLIILTGFNNRYEDKDKGKIIIYGCITPEEYLNLVDLHQNYKNEDKRAFYYGFGYNLGSERFPLFSEEKGYCCKLDCLYPLDTYMERLKL
ncbi:hypothetical protein NSS82_19120 [Paenibacillus sp. FSL H7-0735]|uniref:hypothetical protein n=1 Tax=Paenibacillus sp. FSL H7-0735 TaxID=2954736 RepID=UPI0030F5FF61